MVKTDLATGLASPASTEFVAPAKAKAAKPTKAFPPKPNTRPENLRAAFDDTCARYPKTLARLAE